MKGSNTRRQHWIWIITPATISPFVLLHRQSYAVRTTVYCFENVRKTRNYWKIQNLSRAGALCF